MKTYLNELHKQCKDNYNIKTNNSSSKKDINLSKINNNNNNCQNKLTNNKSGLFLNNFFQTTNSNNSTNVKVNNSYKKSTNTLNSLKNFKKKKRINVTPYQGIKNEYILGLAMDNLNKYQENILLKENNEENLDNIIIDDENAIFDEFNNKTNSKINYYSSNIINKNNSNKNQIMNKTQENFHINNQFYKNTNSANNLNNISSKISNKKEKINNNDINNKYYNDYFLKNDLFSKDAQNEATQYYNNTNQYNYNNKSESYMPTNTVTKNKSFNYFKNTNNNKINNINDINFEKNYENKFNIFINKTFDLKNENSKQNKAIQNSKNKKIIDKKLTFVLNNLELKELIELFEKNYIFFDDLFLLSKEDLVEMKIPIGPRNRIINFIEKFKNYGKSYDFDELTSFMNKYKKVLININDNNSNDVYNFNVTPLTNNKYKSNMTTENNKNKGSIDSPSSDFPGKGLNMSNLEDVETISQRNEEIKDNKYFNSKPKNKNRINKNNINNQNKIVNDINKLINITKSKDNDKYNQNVLKNKIENNMNNKIKTNNDSKCNTSRIKDKYNKFINLDNEDNYKERNDNIFTNSLFKEFTPNINDNINETNYSINNLDVINKNKRNININKDNNYKKDNTNNILKANSSKIKENSLPFEDNVNININNYDSPSLNFINNKKNNTSQNTFKNFLNIFSEIENYQINYEKMKKENDNRNNKINYLLEKRNRPNLQYLKMKIKNSKYYNDDDLKNESVRNLKNELEKMNFQKENDNNQLNSIKYNPSVQNYLKARNNKTNINPLIEEFNKHK